MALKCLNSKGKAPHTQSLYFPFGFTICRLKILNVPCEMWDIVRLYNFSALSPVEMKKTTNTFTFLLYGLTVWTKQ